MGCVGTHYTDEELIELYKASRTLDEAKFYIESLLERYQTRVVLWCLRLTGSREQASDLAQDIFLKTYRGLNQFRGESKFSRWLYQIVRNHCMNYLQRSKQAITDQLEPTALLSLDDKQWKDVIERIERREIVEAFTHIINSELDATERKVLYLHYADGLKLPEITQMLNLTNKSGAKAYIVSAKRKVQKRMLAWLKHRRMKGSTVIERAK